MSFTMRLLLLFGLAFLTQYLSALPIGSSRQAVLAPPKTSSFDSSSSRSGTSINSDSSSRGSLKDRISSFLPGSSTKSSSSSTLQCQVYPSQTPNVLATLASTIRQVLNDHNDQLFLSSSSKKFKLGKPKSPEDEDQENITFKTCLAGYKPLRPASPSASSLQDASDDAAKLSPTIIFSAMSKRQSQLVETIMNNQVLRNFPSVKVVKDAAADALSSALGRGKGALALVVGG